MQRITLDTILRLIDHTMDLNDLRLAGHSEQVAYITYKLALELGITDQKTLKILCKTAFLHDVGYYKIKAKHSFINPFNPKRPHAHAAYGAVFLSTFYNEDVIPDLVKWHHTPWKVQQKNSCRIPELSTLIYFADRIAINIVDNNSNLHVFEESGLEFSPEHVAAYARLNEDDYLINRIKTGEYRSEIRMFFSQFILDREQLLNFASMMTFALDFNSPTSLLHSIFIMGVTRKMTDFFPLSDEEKQNIIIAASLHDIGKLVVPTSILEKPGALSQTETHCMRYHAMAGYNILTILGLDDIRDLASFHHESLDGKGYPFGLKADELPFGARLIAVTDIASALLAKRSYKKAFPTNQVIQVLQNLSDIGKLDPEIVAVFCDNFEEIHNTTVQEIKPSEERYATITRHYKDTLRDILLTNKNSA